VIAVTRHEAVDVEDRATVLVGVDLHDTGSDDVADVRAWSR
jgi:hypothetical protein